MVATEGYGDYGLDEEDAWFIKANVGCKWGMTAHRLFIPLIVSFHLLRYSGVMRMKRGMRCAISTFYW
jgi:hypothetical protein